MLLPHVLAKPAVLPAPSACSFAVRRSPELPTYQELVLEDAQGPGAHWVMAQPLKQLARRPGVQWRLGFGPHSCFVAP